MGMLTLCPVDLVKKMSVNIVLRSKQSIYQQPLKLETPKASSEPDKEHVQTTDFDIGKMQCEDTDLKNVIKGYKKGLNPIGETFLI